MNNALMMAVMVAAISEGHTDLADLLFLIAAILLTVLAVLELVGKAVTVPFRALAVAAAALLAWAFFVL